MRKPIDEVFPFPSYFEHQEEILKRASTLLYGVEGIDNVIIDAPTGIGKSPINTALARQAESAFITTPQKKLRQQLEEDEDLNPYYSVLRAREDYGPCPAARLYTDTEEEFDCESCLVNKDPTRSCTDREHNCPYWDAKESAMDDSVSVTTFSYLIVDGNLDKWSEPNEDGDQKRLSFGNRELLVVDEAHALESQVANLHAGFSISPEGITESLYASVRSRIEEEVHENSGGVLTTNDISDLLETILKRAGDRQEEIDQQLGTATEDDVREELLDELQDLRSVSSRLGWLLSDRTTWVVEADMVYYQGDKVPAAKVTPVFVSEFLKDHVWNRAEKVVLSTATMPYRDSPDKWAKRLGLDPSRTETISKPMPFPASNREVHTRSIIDRFSGGADADNWGQIVDTLSLIASKHSGEKGLVHTVSYDRAEKLYYSLKANSVLHEQSNPEKSEMDYIREWQTGEKDMLLSPALMEGVDLPDKQCRWQALVKIPYPATGDARVSYLLDVEKDWDWYYEETAQSVIQSVGRGVRHSEDYCDYYVLDQSFEDVMEHAEIPKWFEEAVVE